MSQRQAIADALSLIFQAIEKLHNEFPNRDFTIDGRLVGDIGEVIAALEYDIDLDIISRPIHDAVSSDNRNIQIKATFKNSLTFKSIPDYYLGFKLYPDGKHEEVFNGPGSIIYERYSHRKNIGVSLLSFPISELILLSKKVESHDRIHKRVIT